MAGGGKELAIDTYNRRLPGRLAAEARRLRAGRARSV
jgi:hypothetical protein